MEDSCDIDVFYATVGEEIGGHPRAAALEKTENSYAAAAMVKK